MSVNSKMTAIADKIRDLRGVSGTMSLDAMASHLGNEQAGLASALAALAEKGVTVPSGTKVDGLAALIAAIEAGGGSDGGNDDALIGVIERTATDITLPSGLTSVGSYAFSKCTNLALTSLPAGITKIDSRGFNECANLALTSLPAGITTIGAYAFIKCTNLALTSLPAGITKIDSNSFSDCTGLSEITFEGKPNSINSTAFKNCTNLLTINVPWAEGEVANAPWGATNATINYNYTGG